MGKAFYDDEQKRMKLDRTVCLYKGDPYYVEAVHQKENMVYLYHIDDRKKPKFMVSYLDPEFDYRAFPLGYTNHGENSYYVSRIPDRQNSQGLGAHLLSFRPQPDRNIYINDWLMTDACYNTIKGIYPTLEECLATVKPFAGGKNSRAFHRQFAISLWDNNFRLLCYRGRGVGFLSDKGEVKLFDAKDKSLIKLAAERAGVTCL